MLFASLVDDPGEELPEPTASRERERLFSLVERLAEFDAYKDTTTQHNTLYRRSEAK